MIINFEIYLRNSLSALNIESKDINNIFMDILMLSGIISKEYINKVIQLL